jgi:hypothetical protein
MTKSPSKNKPSKISARKKTWSDPRSLIAGASLIMAIAIYPSIAMLFNLPTLFNPFWVPLALSGGLIIAFGAILVFRLITEAPIKPYILYIAFLLVIVAILVLASWSSGADRSCTGFMGVQTSCSELNKLTTSLIFLNPRSLMMINIPTVWGIIGLLQPIKESSRTKDRDTPRAEIASAQKSTYRRASELYIIEKILLPVPIIIAVAVIYFLGSDPASFIALPIGIFSALILSGVIRNIFVRILIELAAVGILLFALYWLWIYLIFATSTSSNF